MADIRSDHARMRAMDLLAMADPVAEDEESRRLRELAVKYLEVAERLEAEDRDRAGEPSEMISAALDAVARDYFSRTARRAMSRNKPKQDGE
jgi:hypothetical protein